MVPLILGNHQILHPIGGSGARPAWHEPTNGRPPGSQGFFFARAIIYTGKMGYICICACWDIGEKWEIYGSWTRKWKLPDYRCVMGLSRGSIGDIWGSTGIHIAMWGAKHSWPLLGASRIRIMPYLGVYIPMLLEPSP